MEINEPTNERMSKTKRNDAKWNENEWCTFSTKVTVKSSVYWLCWKSAVYSLFEGEDEDTKKVIRTQTDKIQYKYNHSTGIVSLRVFAGVQHTSPAVFVSALCLSVWFPPHFLFLSANVRSFAHRWMLSLRLRPTTKHCARVCVERQDFYGAQIPKLKFYQDKNISMRALWKRHKILANRKKKLTKRNREHKMNKQPKAVVPCTNRIIPNKVTWKLYYCLQSPYTVHTINEWRTSWVWERNGN